MTVRPQRIPHSSPMIDTTGIVSVPASTNTDAIEKPVDRARGGIASAERGEEAGHDEREARGDHDVGRDREPHDRRPREHDHGATDDEHRLRQQPEHELRVPGEVLHAEPGADGEADELRGSFDEAEHPAAGRVVEAEDVAVEEGAEDREAGDRGREEREHAVDAAEAVDLPAHAPRFGDRRRRFLGLARVGVGARELLLLHAAARLGQRRAREHEEHGRDREDEERDVAS